MAFRIREFATLQEAQLFLRGGIRGSIKLVGRIQNLHDKTLIFTQPASATITFDESAGEAGVGGGLTVKEIQDQIIAGVATLKVGLMEGGLALEEATPANGVTVTGEGTANPLLGFKAGGDSVGTVVNPIGGTAPTAEWLPQSKITADGYFLVVNEA